ncbi:MAG: NTP transferase domain-containing protein [Planctomycetota bacterium]
MSAGVVPLILAAGASQRMGRAKAAVAVGGRPALERILRVCASAGVGPARVVVGAHPAAARAVAPGARQVHNPRWALGRTTSIQAGLRAIGPAPAVLLWPVDVCLPDVYDLLALLEARRRHPDRALWVPSHAERRGHPVLLGPAAQAALLALGPTQPARAVVRALAARGRVEHVERPSDACLRDLNRPADVRGVLA